MADRVSIAIRQEQAMNRLETRMGDLAGKLGIDLPAIPRRHQDAEMLRALQLEAIANAVDLVLEHVGDAEIDEDYSEFGKADLVLEFQKRKLDVELVQGTGVNGNVLVQDLRDALIADDGGSS